MHAVKSMSEKNDLHDYVRQEHRWLADEYQRVRERAREDPGTAGDEGESNWRQLLEKWLPPAYRVVTKGRLLFPNGAASGQVDVLILKPGYPPGLTDRKLYIAGGVAFVFECKTTLRPQHLSEAIEKLHTIREYGDRFQTKATPRDVLAPGPGFGLLAHSSVWENPNERVAAALGEHHLAIAHPSRLLDLICVADGGTFMAERGAEFPNVVMRSDGSFGADGVRAMSVYRGPQASNLRERQDTALGRLVWYVLRRLAWDEPAIRSLVQHYHSAGLGEGGGVPKFWLQESVLPDVVLAALQTQHSIGVRWPRPTSIEWDEWSGIF